MGDGTRLVVLRDPLGGPADDPAPPLVADGPGSVAAGSSTRAAEAGLTAPDRERRELDVTSTSGRIIRVSSHYPFDRVNARLVFDRDMAAGFRLDIPAGDTVRWAPGETRRVRLVRYGGESGR